MRVAMVAAGFTSSEAEELRRAMGSKRSVERMAKLEARLREGMTRNGYSPQAQDNVVRGITSFALYGFPSRTARASRNTRVRQRVHPRALARVVLRGAAQPLAHGLLPPGHGGATPSNTGSARRP